MPDRRVLGCAISFMLASAAASAQNYPAKPVRMLVGFAPGGGADIVARSLAPRLSELLAQQLVVDNRPGANGIIAADIASKSPPDGYTLLVAPGNYAFAPAMVAKLPFDMANAFAAVGKLVETPLLMVVHPSLPATSVRELVALARTRPGQVTYATAGVGGAAHLATELLAAMTQVSLVHIPYKGTAPALIDLLGGQVTMCICTLPSTLPHVKSSRLRALGVTTAQRAPALPDVPTIAEAGIAGYEMSQWYGLLAPAGTPSAIVERLNADANRALQHPEIRSRLQTEGAQPAGSTPQEFGVFFKAEIAKWSGVVRKAGIRAE
jgi:tripartite-type tricarboxylate transporter receptor subunit TctC